MSLGLVDEFFAIDRDDDAIAEASTRLTAELESGRLTILRGNFSEMGSLLEEKGVNQVDGILLDLGVSSHQLDEADRGFSHRLSGPLDMRMDQSQDDDAADLVNQLEEDQLANVIYQFGEERRSRRIARAIVRGPSDSVYRATSRCGSFCCGTGSTI